MQCYEVNFDGIVGPTHHYGGLSLGNVASQTHRHRPSYPRQAALQGLEKMTLLAGLGLKQGVLPPHERPHMAFLHRHGFSGSDAQIVERAARERPDLLSIAYSASSMWAANTATASPSLDTDDGRLHLTPANLVSTPHRMLESEFSTTLLRRIFPDRERFVVHDPLPAEAALSDEGAANHTRLCPSHSSPGVAFFVYGRDDSDARLPVPQDFPARQSRLASESVARRHLLNPQRTLFAQQHPEAIDAGVFHNDVIAVGNENVLLCHERAFWNQAQVLQQLERSCADLLVIQVRASELSAEEAVGTYLFNSQLLTLPDGNMLLLSPSDCAANERARGVIDRIVAESNPVQGVHYIDVRQSMQNGGGPACLRLRVVLTSVELANLLPGVLLTDSLAEQLREWITRHYREELSIAELADPKLLDEVRTALDELSRILGLGTVYPCQHA